MKHLKHTENNKIHIHISTTQNNQGNAKMRVIFC